MVSTLSRFIKTGVGALSGPACLPASDQVAIFSFHSFRFEGAVARLPYPIAPTKVPRVLDGLSFDLAVAFAPHLDHLEYRTPVSFSLSTGVCGWRCHIPGDPHQCRLNAARCWALARRSKSQRLRKPFRPWR